MSQLISLVVAVFNREDYLAQTLASICVQTYPNWELLIWDDGSSDRSREIAVDFARQDARIRVMTAPNQGVAMVLRQAISQTHGPYLGWVDSDDWLAPTALEDMSAILNEHPEVGVVYSDYADVDVQGNIRGRGQRCAIPYSPQRLLLDFMTFQFRLIRRKVYEQVGGIEPRAYLAEDYDLCLRLSEVTGFLHLEKILYYYRHHLQSISHQRRLEQIMASRDAIQRTLGRRGMSDRLTIDVELIGRFSLRPVSKPAPPTNQT